jgi:hypothetical protein
MRKTFECQVKAEAKAGGGTRFRAVASTGTQDRQGEYLEPSGAKMVRGAPLLYGHEYGELRQNIGVCHKMTVEDGQVIVEGEFDDDIPEHVDAVIAAGKAKKGSLQYLSVGFNPLSVRSPDGKVRRLKPGEWAWPEVGQGYPDWEMVELSFVPVPANPEAELISARADANEKEYRLNLVRALEAVLTSDQFMARLRNALKAETSGLIPTETEKKDEPAPEPKAPAPVPAPAPAEPETPAEEPDELEAFLAAEPEPDEIDELFAEAEPTGAGAGAPA